MSKFNNKPIPKGYRVLEVDGRFQIQRKHMLFWWKDYGKSGSVTHVSIVLDVLDALQQSQGDEDVK